MFAKCHVFLRHSRRRAPPHTFCASPHFLQCLSFLEYSSLFHAGYIVYLIYNTKYAAKMSTGVGMSDCCISGIKVNPAIHPKPFTDSIKARSKTESPKVVKKSSVA